MTDDRWTALMDGNNEAGPNLTADEMADGWHWCWEFDGLLVGPGMGEMDCCVCPGVNKSKHVSTEAP